MSAEKTIYKDKAVASLDLVLGSAHPDAFTFILKFGSYCHLIDDIIDEKITNYETILNSQRILVELLSSEFYTANKSFLYPIIILIVNDYFNSVRWEKSDLLYQREASDVLRHAAINLVAIIVYHYFGYDTMLRMTELFRDNAYELHHNEKGERV